MPVFAAILVVHYRARRSGRAAGLMRWRSAAFFWPSARRRPCRTRRLRFPHRSNENDCGCPTTPARYLHRQSNRRVKGQPMPLVRIDLPKGKTAAFAKAVSQGIQAALVETFNVPRHDLFQVITSGPDTQIVHATSYLGIAYSQDLTVIQLTVSDTRSIEQKKRLFATIAENLARDPGLRPDDIFINLVEVQKENWSFGRGVAQNAQ
jgi:phenylpyruvate tautomerase PptA (4-oxalocrotonate tautomerase family)